MSALDTPLRTTALKVDEARTDAEVGAARDYGYGRLDEALLRQVIAMPEYLAARASVRAMAMDRVATLQGMRRLVGQRSAA